MRANAIVMFGLAVVFGVAAVFLSNMWLNTQEPRAALITPDQHPENTIVVAAVPLKFGDRITADDIRAIPWTAGAMPVGAFTETSQLLGDKAGERQALTAMAANEPILGWKVTGAGERATLSAVLATGMKAVSIRVNDVAGVAGFVLPGDRVDVLLTRRNGANSSVDVLLQNVKVLAIDQTADDKKENPTVAKSVTVEVSTLDAQKLTLAAGIGDLSLALRRQGASAADPIDHVTLADLIPGAAPQPVEKVAEGKPAPAAAAAPATPPPAPVNPFAQIEVFRGMSLSTYNVPRVK
jgi:pilus assembly protein CpaB